MPRVDRGGANPIQADEAHGERAGDDGAVHGPGGLGVAEVGEGELEEVEDVEEEGPAEVAAAPEVDGAEGEQVVGDEVRGQVAGVLDVRLGLLRLRVQRRQVRYLQRVQHDPVHGHDGRRQREGRVVAAVYAPDGAAAVLPFVWAGEGVVDAGYDEEQVSDCGGDAVGDDASARVFGAGLERVDCGEVRRGAPSILEAWRSRGG